MPPADAPIPTTRNSSANLILRGDQRDALADDLAQQLRLVGHARQLRAQTRGVAAVCTRRVPGHALQQELPLLDGAESRPQGVLDPFVQGDQQTLPGVGVPRVAAEAEDAAL